MEKHSIYSLLLVSSIQQKPSACIFISLRNMPTSIYLGYMTIPYLTFQGPAKLFSIATVTLHFLTTLVRGLQFLQILLVLLLFLFLL